MKPIKLFIAALKKQGLVMAHLVVREKEYRYSPERGLTETVHEPAEEVKAGGPDEKKRTPVSYRLALALLFITLLLFVVVVVLNQRLSRKDIEPPMDSPQKTGESGSVTMPGDRETKTGGIDKPEEKPLQDGVPERVKPVQTESGGLKTPVTEKIEARTGADRGGDKNKQPAEAYQEEISIRSLQPDQITEYHSLMNTLRVDLPKKVAVTGTCSLEIYIDKNGRIYLFRTHDSGIDIQPDSRRERVILRLKQMVSALRFPPPLDRNGRPVRVESWRLNYMVTQFKRRMILRKQ